MRAAIVSIVTRVMNGRARVSHLGNRALRCGDLYFAPKGHSQGSPGQSAAAQPRSAALVSKPLKQKIKTKIRQP
jgi:hypothetical protein